MSFVEEFKREFIDKVLYYTQEEGLKDHEVADILGCSRATVNRTRQANEIPTANLRNRKDKKCTCEECNVKYLIRRKERRKKSCEVCIKNK
jgi:predicted transcriptional regulator